MLEGEQTETTRTARGGACGGPLRLLPASDPKKSLS